MIKCYKISDNVFAKDMGLILVLFWKSMEIVVRKRNDMILLLAILLPAVIIMTVMSLNKNAGGQVKVTVDGELYGIYDLDKKETIVIENEEGFKNIVEIENGYVYMKEADCRDLICVNQGNISKKSETIVCLPHKVVVEVISGEESEADVIAK